MACLLSKEQWQSLETKISQENNQSLRKKPKVLQVFWSPSLCVYQEAVPGNWCACLGRWHPPKPENLIIFLHDVVVWVVWEKQGGMKISIKKASSHFQKGNGSIWDSWGVASEEKPSLPIYRINIFSCAMTITSRGTQ